jgi:hypothetical protein
MLHLRIMMRSGGCVAFSQNTDTDTGEGWSGVHGAAQYERFGCPDMDVRTSRFEGCYLWSGPEVVEITFLGYKVV